jgi:iron complex transport system ATP-binding protein
MSSAHNPILEFRDIAFSYTRTNFINGLSLSVGEADFVGLLGANGSGKSTILRLLGGILKPSGGRAALWGKAIASYRNRDRAKLVSYLPQSLDGGVPFRVEELVRMGVYPYDRVTGLDVPDALRTVGLSEKRDVLLSELSGGEKRRAFIAMTLVQGAGILLLDEPLANLDIRYQMEMMRLLRELNEKRNISIVMALHDINLALQFDRLLLIQEGRLLAKGTPQDVLTEARIREAFGIDMRVRGDGKETYIHYGDMDGSGDD